MAGKAEKVLAGMFGVFLDEGFLANILRSAIKIPE